MEEPVRTPNGTVQERREMRLSPGPPSHHPGTPETMKETAASKLEEMESGKLLLDHYVYHLLLKKE